ncbi:MAG: RsiV family protein [Bacteroidales bacterium]|nr:RsiV family protein [Bacteroidales bacterium]
MNKQQILTVIVAVMITAASCGGQQPQTTASADAVGADNAGTATIAAPEFKTFVKEKFEKHPQGAAANDGFSYKVELVYPSVYGDQAVLEKLQSRFLGYTLGDRLAAMAPEEAMDAYIAAWRQAYYDGVEEMQNVNADPDFVTGWHLTCSNAVIFINDVLLQLVTMESLYPAESQVYENVAYHLFNLQTGNEYRRDDIFKPGAANDIRKLITAELLKQWDIQSLDEWGIENERIWTPESAFAITAKGITMLYKDDYFVSDPFTIPYTKIKPCLRQGTPVWEVAEKNSSER